jgi:hypothetical protein
MICNRLNDKCDIVLTLNIMFFVALAILVSCGAAIGQTVSNPSDYAESLISESVALGVVNYCGDATQFVAEINDDYLCGISQGRLKVFRKDDVRDISSYYLTSSRIMRIFEYYKGYVYLPRRSDGIHIFDVNDPSAIRFVGKLDYGHFSYATLPISEEIMYVPVMNKNQIVALSLADPENPEELSRCDLGKSVTPQHICVVDNMVYVLGSRVLIAVDYTDITAPVIAGSIPFKTNSSVGGLTVKGSYAYFFTDGKMYIFDISNPEEITSAGRIKAKWRPYANLRKGHIIGFHGNSTSIYNLSNPIKPRKVLGNSGASEKLLMGKDSDWVVNSSGSANKDGGSSFIYVGDRFAFESNTVIAQEQYLYTFSMRGLRVFDISSPAEPKQVSALDSLRFSRSAVLLDGDYLYTPREIIDVSDPHKPVRCHKFTGGSGKGMDITGDYLFRCNHDGFDIYNVADPSSPRKLTSMVVDGEVSRIVIANGVVFIGLNTGVIKSYSFNKSLELVMLDEVQLSSTKWGTVMDMSLEGDLLYVALNGDGIASVDISDPEDLKIYASFDTSQFSEQVVAIDSFAYVADGSGGTCIIDMSKKGHEKIIASHPTSDWSNSLCVNGNFVYTTQSDNGFVIYSSVLTLRD